MIYLLNMKNYIMRFRYTLFSLGVIILFLITLGIQRHEQAVFVENINTTIASTTQLFNNEMKNLEDQYSNARVTNQYLINTLNNEQGKNTIFQDQIAKVNDTANTLVTLSKIDPQLLQKYSKTYFLNENYIPSKLADINAKYLSDNKGGLQIYANVKPFLENMLQSANSENVNLKVLSAYR